MATIIKLPSAGRAPVRPVEHREAERVQFEDKLLAFPLSAAQERVWQADRRNPGNPAYNCAFRWSLRGSLNISVLDRAFNEIVRRHEILRASFTQIDANPVQLIAPSAELKISVNDLRSVPELERESQMDRLCAEEARRSFDIGKGPLIQVRLVHMEERRHVLLLTLHLLVADGWSVRVIMAELQKLYAAYSEGRESPLSSLTIQYPDFVVWQQEGRAGREVANQLAYWKSKLVGYHRLEVAGDIPLRAELTRNSQIVSLELPRELTDALSEFGNLHGGTMFVTALAACKVLLCRYTGKFDIAVGSELAGRNRAEVEGLVGLFINHVTFRTDVSGDPQFPDLVKRVRETTWEIFANQDVAFEDVIKARKTDGDPCPDPFTGINFNCYRAYGGSSNFVLEPSGTLVVPVPSISPEALYCLNFFMVERESGWRLSLEYKTDLYSHGFAQQMLADFRELLEGISTNPDRKISEFQVSGMRERDRSDAPRVAAAINMAYGIDGDDASDAFYTLPASVVQERFWLLAKLDPTGSRFHMRATVRLTGPLAREALEKSFQVLVDRHEILRTTFAEQGGGLNQIIASRKIFSLSSLTLEDIAEVNREARLQELLREEARYPFDLLHGPLLRARLFCLQPDDHVLIITTHHIIADGWSQRVLQDEIWSIYESLTSDRPLSLAPLSIQYADFATWQKEWLASQEAAEHLDFWLKRLEGPLRTLDFPTDRPPATRIASNGGIESFAMPGDLMRALKDLSKSENVTMFTLMLACFAILLFRCANQCDVVIGSPVANRRPETEPLIGPFAGPIPFRLDMSDDPTLREVLRRANQTSLDALDHAVLPFEALLGQLRVQSVSGRTVFFQFYFLYQTAFLQGHKLPGLTVTPMPTFSVGTPFELQLAVIERQDEVRANLEYNSDLFDPETIRDLLRYYERLLRALVANPDWHVAKLEPPTIGERGHWPSRGVSEVRRPYVAPRSDDEKVLSEIWKHLLKVPRIGVHDNFFELGGHSLLAAHLVSQVKRQFSVTIDLSILMVAPTIEQLAQRLSPSLEKDQSHVVPLQTSGTKPPLFCIHGGGGHLLDYREFFTALPEDQPLYGLRASDVNEAYPETVEQLADKYLQDIQRIQQHGPYQICGLSFGGLVAYEVARRLAEKGERIGVIALLDTGNWAHYRNLPASKMVQFRRTYVVDRLKKYARNLLHARFDDLASDARQFIASRLSAFLWQTSRRACRLMNRPVPKVLRSNIVIFSAVGREYSPKPYPGRLLLFRAEGRTAEYGDDLTLGWSDMAREGVVVHQVPGSHLSIMHKPHVYRLVEKLNPYLIDTLIEGGDAGCS
jgi:non-ribosomal peptide synthetase component F/thioesterase domain-containing protein